MACSKQATISDYASNSLRTECGICMSKLENLKILPCLHSFCLECLKKVKHPQGIVTCPLCKENAILPSEGLDGFRENHFINQRTDLDVISKKRDIGRPCVNCEAVGYEVLARCEDCNGFLCRQCVNLHQTNTPQKDHSVFTIDGYVDKGEVVTEVNCKKHKDQALQWFCQTCSSPICKECTKIDHVRPDHEYITIDSVNEIQVNNIKALMESCIGLTEQLTNAIVDTEEVDLSLAKSVDKIMKKIDEEKKAYLDPIERSYREIMARLAQVQAKKATKISVTKTDLQNKISKLTNVVQVASQIITSGSKHDLALNYSIVSKSLTDVQQTEMVAGVNTELGEIKFTSRTNGEIMKKVDMGSISENEKCKWVLEKEIGKKGVGKIKSGFGVTVNRNKDIRIADWSDKDVKIFDSQGDFKGEIIGNLTRPHGIVMSHDGTRQYVTDCTGLVHIFNQQGKKVKQFPSISPDGKASDTDGSILHGLAVNNAGNILVGNNDMYISKHRPDGTYICSFKTNIPPTFITVTRQGRIIICPNASTKNAEIIDNKGKLLHTIYKPHDAKSWCPCSCCCSDDGLVYITSCYGRSTEGGIYSFTEDGTYLGCVTTDVSYTGGIALIDDDRLVVAQSYDLPAKIFCYKEA